MEPRTASESEPQRVGPYRLVRELGRGGQAIVWLAEDSRIGRQVALKMLPHLGPGGDEALRRFRREAEVAARLEHPGICSVFEAEIDHGTPYIAMRYVSGETLARRIATARDAHDAPPDRDALRDLALLFEKAARALHAAHEAGIVHRDVKPANLMITPEGEPVVLDFGLAREDDAAAQAVTLTGETSGTPAYMSPEQMTGRSRPDRRTDVWSLGIALYESTTLAHPFASATRESLFQAILSDDPADPRRLNTAIDRDFATILETATAKERDRRYQTALDLAEDLRRWRANEPIRARPVSRLERVGRWMQRKPALAASLAAAVVLLIAASAFLSYGIGAASRADAEAKLRSLAQAAQTSAESAQSKAEEAQRLAETERARAETARAALEQVQKDRALGEALDELGMEVGTLWFGFEAKETVPALVPKYLAAFRAFGIDVERDADASSSKATLVALSRRNEELGRVVQDALRTLAEIAAAGATESVTSLTLRANALLAAFPEADWPELDAAVQRWQTDASSDAFGPLLADEVLAKKGPDQIYHLAGALFSMPGRFDDAQRVLAKLLEMDPGSFRGHFLAAALGFTQMFKTGGMKVEGSQPILDDLLHHLDVAVALRPKSGFVRAMLANALALDGRYAEAIHCMDRATEIEPANAVVWLFRARFYGYTPEPERGVEACKKALEIDPGLPGAKKLLEELEAKTKKS